MKLQKALLPVLLAAVWISVSEFARNEFLLKRFWQEHYAGLGLTFPGDPINGALWGVWSLVFAVFIYWISRRFPFSETVGIAWLAGFVMMWLVVGNLGVLPMGLLVYAIPLSLLECWVATWIIEKISQADSRPGRS